MALTGTHWTVSAPLPRKRLRRLRREALRVVLHVPVRVGELARVTPRLTPTKEEKGLRNNS
jgi:hypothetical protein